MIGHRVWAIPEGYIPGRSFSQQRELVSHEAAAILNASDEPASIELTVYFADRDPAGACKVEVALRRTKDVRFNDLTEPEPAPHDTPYASVIRSNVPIVVQRLDSRDPHIALQSTQAFSVES